MSDVKREVGSLCLLKSCVGGRVEHLGRHRAFHAEGLPADRALFAVIREEPYE